eukprot:CAMPEP_0201573098 /NCGR_PEP_ID=MMETSP0190_2-20130828/16763_1 /ASSEMBLY_ACC=CAM_ASM_000263 /TAXON_ID=37353 /ORGANISM="Rosalina sp." /LENGTH=80 /DNA_ID=CAMNT_0047999661 /DNA_START=62 /DNA_END=300 /DNA_ORIENTATION=-
MTQTMFGDTPTPNGSQVAAPANGHHNGHGVPQIVIHQPEITPSEYTMNGLGAMITPNIGTSNLNLIPTTELNVTTTGMTT